jgi:hypothetical protein
MKSDIHIFIIFNPMPNIYLPNLIQQLGIKVFKVVEFYSKPIITTIEPEYLKRFNHCSNFQYAHNVRSAVTYINSIIQPYHSVTFYFSHPFNAVANYFFFQINPAYHYILIPDGMVNYCHMTTNAFILKMISKKIMGWLLGIPYSLYFTHITGVMEQKYDTVITFHETGLIHGGQKILKLRLAVAVDKSAAAKTNSILILGQSYKNASIYFHTYQEIFKYIRTIYGTECQVVYKCHPNELVTPKFKLLLHKYDIALLHRSEQAEYLAAEYGIIISEASSALFNIKIIYGEQVRCLAFIKNKPYLSGRRFKDEQILEIKEQLQRIGAEIVE